LQQSRYDRISGDEDYIGCHRHHFCGCGAHALSAFAGEPIIEPDIAALVPAEVLEALPEGRKVGLPDLIVLGESHDHADPPHPIRLLRARR
jgi:hypothetical protein